MGGLEKTINVRVTEELLERADKLIRYIEDDPEYAPFGRPSRSTVLRLALFKGVEALEERYGESTKKRR